jgi:hypothetical protein
VKCETGVCTTTVRVRQEVVFEIDIETPYDLDHDERGVGVEFDYAGANVTRCHPVRGAESVVARDVESCVRNSIGFPDMAPEIRAAFRQTKEYLIDAAINGTRPEAYDVARDNAGTGH